MLELTELVILRPWWLLAAVAMSIAGWLILRRLRPLGSWSGHIDEHLQEYLQQAGFLQLGQKRLARWYPVVAGVVLAIALSGPGRLRPEVTTYRKLDAMVLVMDMSRSMTDGGNLDNAKAAASLLNDAADGRPVGLIVYAGDAYIATSPTIDPNIVASQIAVLDGTTMPDKGSNITAALRLASTMLDGAPGHRHDIVIIGDGGGIDAQSFAAAESLAAAEWRMSAIYVPRATPVYGMPEAQPDVLKRLAETGGGLSAATDSMGDISRLAQAAPVVAGSDDVAMALIDDLGRYLLLAAMLPLLLMFRRVGRR
jgi:Ca-activated chloride channel family protein